MISALKLFLLQLDVAVVCTKESSTFTVKKGMASSLMQGM